MLVVYADQIGQILKFTSYQNPYKDGYHMGLINYISQSVVTDYFMEFQDKYMENLKNGPVGLNGVGLKNGNCLRNQVKISVNYL